MNALGIVLLLVGLGGFKRVGWVERSETQFYESLRWVSQALPTILRARQLFQAHKYLHIVQLINPITPSAMLKGDFHFRQQYQLNYPAILLLVDNPVHCAVHE
jgi:hypothetical protein